jgi:hypothetical protein
VAAGDHTTVDGALHDINAHLVAKAPHKITAHMLLNRLSATAIEVLHDAATMVVFTAAVLQHQVDNHRWNTALLLSHFPVASRIHLLSLVSWSYPTYREKRASEEILIKSTSYHFHQFGHLEVSSKIWPSLSEIILIIAQRKILLDNWQNSSWNLIFG